MAAEFFRKYDFVWKGGSPSSDSQFGPYPAKIIVGVTAAVDPQTGMSASLPVMDRKITDLIRILDFSFAGGEAGTKLDMSALLKNLMKRYEDWLKAEEADASGLRVSHLEIRFQNHSFKRKSSESGESYVEEKRLRAESPLSAGHIWIAADRAADLKRALQAFRETQKSGTDAELLVSLYQDLGSPLRYQNWVSKEQIRLG